MERSAPPALTSHREVGEEAHERAGGGHVGDGSRPSNDKGPTAKATARDGAANQSSGSGVSGGVDDDDDRRLGRFLAETEMAAVASLARAGAVASSGDAGGSGSGGSGSSPLSVSAGGVSAGAVGAARSGFTKLFTRRDAAKKHEESAAKTEEVEAVVEAAASQAQAGTAALSDRVGGGSGGGDIYIYIYAVSTDRCLRWTVKDVLVRRTALRVLIPGLVRTQSEAINEVDPVPARKRARRKRRGGQWLQQRHRRR